MFSEQTSLALSVSARCGVIAVAFLPFNPPPPHTPPPSIAQDWSGNHGAVCLSVCKSQEAAPAKSPKSSECSKPRCQNNTIPSLPPAGPLSVIITCLSHSLGLQQVQAERPLHPARGEGRRHHPAHAVCSQGPLKETVFPHSAYSECGSVNIQIFT